MHGEEQQQRLFDLFVCAWCLVEERFVKRARGRGRKCGAKSCPIVSKGRSPDAEGRCHGG